MTHDEPGPRRGERDWSSAAGSEDQAWRRNVRRDIDLGSVREAECASEPIHLPGAIQDFGSLIAVDEASGRIDVADERCADLFGVPPAGLLGRRPEAVLSAPLAELIARVGRSAELLGGDSVALRLDPPTGVRAHAHRWRGRVLCELIPSGPGSHQLHRLARVDGMIQRAPGGGAWQLACDELSALSGYDRVLGYAMEESGDGRVVAEALRGGETRSLLGMAFPAADIPPQARALYVRNKARYCPDVGYVPLRLLRSAGAPEVDLSFARLRSLSPFHIQYQRDLGVAAAASYSVVVEGVLGGLLIGHHFQPHEQSHDQRLAAGMIARFLSRSLSKERRCRATRQRTEAASAYAGLIRGLLAWGTHGEGGAEVAQVAARAFGADGAAIQLGTRVACSDDAIAGWAARAFDDLAPGAAGSPVQTIREAPAGARSVSARAGVLVVAPANGVQLRVLAYRFESTEANGEDPGARVRPDAHHRWEAARARAATEWSSMEFELAAQLHDHLAKAVGPLIGARHLLQRVLEAVPLGVISCVEGGEVVGHNGLAATLLGEDLRGARLPARLRGWSGEDGVIPLLELERPGLPSIPLRVRTLRLSLGQVAWVVFLQDLRAIRELEGRLQEAKHMQAASTLASGLAHDFNNTLTVILTQASLLRENWPSHVEGAELLDDVIRATNQGREVAHQMLAFSRSAHDSETGPACLSATLGESEHMLRALVGDRLTLTVQRPRGSACVPLSRGQIQQVLFILVSNARDAARRGIRVRVERSGGRARLLVSDDGPGFSPELLRRSSESAATTDGPATATHGGLAVAGGIVRDAGGEIRTGNDEGALVTVDLPEVDTDEEPESRPDYRESGPVQSHGRILLVEDSDLVRRGLQRVLERAGYEVTACENGVDALAAFEASPPDLLLTDLSMDGMSGLELIERIMHHGTPCLLLTGHAVVEGLDSITTRVEVLHKPVLPAQLRSALSELLAE